MKTRYAVLLPLVVAACSALTVGEPPREELLAAPTSISVSGRAIALHAELWRDFMPTIGPSEPNGKPLAAVIRFDAGAGNTVPSHLRIDQVWVVFGEQVWHPVFEERLANPPAQAWYEVVARNGPKWGPNVSVDVVVSVIDGGNTLLLRAPNRTIQRVE